MGSLNLMVSPEPKGGTMFFLPFNSLYSLALVKMRKGWRQGGQAQRGTRDINIHH